MFSEILSLIYPHVCLSCKKPLRKSDQHICRGCKRQLPKTNFTSRKENPVMKLLWGKAEVQHASSIFYFNKGNRMQKLMHQLKYKGQEKLGEELGEIMGQELLKEKSYQDIDGIIPIPLHISKYRIRGYNQCDSLAKGLSKVLKTELITEAVIRNRANISQTLKNHFERHVNVEELFEVKKPELIDNRKILLIDDVITTGSTLASCAKAINRSSNSKLMVATLAIADY